MTNKELDVRVAEKVMGMEVGDFGFHGGPSNYFGMAPPNYSTDIAAAWEVVEKMKTEWDFDFEYREHYVCVRIENERGRVSEDKVKSMPLAICLAALKAVETKT